jgi:hypothetical protein
MSRQSGHSLWWFSREARTSAAAEVVFQLLPIKFEYIGSSVAEGRVGLGKHRLRPIPQVEQIRLETCVIPNASN